MFFNNVAFERLLKAFYQLSMKKVCISSFFYFFAKYIKWVYNISV